MPRTVAQLTGMIVTTIIVFGTDMDVYYAMPLGIFAGALATFFVAAAEFKPKGAVQPLSDRAVTTPSS